MNINIYIFFRSLNLLSYKQGTSEEALYCLELWDISGNQAHRNSRNVFYQSYDALVFVHDLTNRKSLVNITNWTEEVLGKSF